MKVRKGFVSNSSSSSFICCITGQVESGMDLGLLDVNMCECVNGHTFSYYNYPKVESWIDGNRSDDDEYGDEYSVPASICPVCTGEAKPDIVSRLKTEMKDLNITVDDLK